VKLSPRIGVILFLLALPCRADVPAFPGAQGGGAAATGGRGGRVIEVTNLNDSGDGSLRACIAAEGPRTCVFRVGGVIPVGVGLRAYKGDLTIAGQTAPGGGITLDGGKVTKQAVLFLSASNVIVRYLTIRIGNGPTHSPGPSTGAVAFQVANAQCHDIIFDHVTASWWDNKGLIFGSNYVGPNTKITTQWSMFYESHAGHPVGPSISSNPEKGQGFGNLETDLDYHHNFLSDIGHRIPQLWNRSTRWVNNIVYNWDYYASQLLGQINADFINNKYKAGPLNGQAQRSEIEATSKGAFENPGAPTIYLLGNIGPNQHNPGGDQWTMAAQITGENGKETGPIPRTWRRAEPLAAEPYPITADSAQELDAKVLPTVGNSLRLDCDGKWVMRRDSVDQRIISEYKKGSEGDFYSYADFEHQIPWIAAGTTCDDSDHDGIPDAWERAHGLNPSDSSDAQKLNPDGYSNLENYLNGSASAETQFAGLTDVDGEAADTGVGSNGAVRTSPFTMRAEAALVRFGYHLRARAARARSEMYWMIPTFAATVLVVVGFVGFRYRRRARAY
jgi:pectate lyase